MNKIMILWPYFSNISENHDMSNLYLENSKRSRAEHDSGFLRCQDRKGPDLRKTAAYGKRVFKNPRQAMGTPGHRFGADVDIGPAQPAPWQFFRSPKFRDSIVI